MSKIKIMRNQTVVFDDIDEGEPFVYEDVLFFKANSVDAFNTTQLYLEPFDADVEVLKVKQVSVALT